MRSRVVSGRSTKPPVGVVDIGSNSIRLVVFAPDSRAPRPLFNEKVLCGLGRGLERTGRLDEEGVELALKNLARFERLARAMKVRKLRAVATAAVRDAKNGPAFAREVRRRAKMKVEILSGDEEARLSAMGVTSGIPGAEGVMGDLGGGSLELVAVNHERQGGHITLPFGPLRLREYADRTRGQLSDTIDRRLDQIPWLYAGKGKEFYAVGGAWRSIARLHMAHVSYPLRVIHHYSVPRGKAEDFLDLIAGLSRESLERIGPITRKRAETLPLAALVMQRVLRRVRPERLVFTALGLREGCLLDELTPAQRRIDPLIDGCEHFARTHARFAPDVKALYAWIAPLFRKRDQELERLQHAACLLSDIAWGEHPDYRAEVAFMRVLHMPLVGVDHPGRAFLALAIYTRYAGSPEGDVARPAWVLLSEDRLRDAYRLGAALRLAFTLSGGAPDALRSTKLKRNGSALQLKISRPSSALVGEVVERRFEALAEAFDRKPRIRVAS